MDFPLLMTIINFNKKKNKYKIYSLYTIQSNIFKYKSYIFNLKELLCFLLFKNKKINNNYFSFYYLNNKIQKDYNFTYFINFKLTNIFINKFNLTILLNKFFLLLKLYFNIFYKYYVEFLYYYNYLFFFKDQIENKKNLFYLFNKNKSLLKDNLIILDKLYYLSYINILIIFNSSFQLQNKININSFIFIGHHQIFSTILNYKFYIPISFFFEMDSLYYNYFGNLIKGKFIYSPIIKIYESIDLFDFIFLKKKYKTIKNKINYFLFLNKIKYYFIFQNFYIFFKQNFILSYQKFYLIQFNLNFIYFSFFKTFIISNFLNNLELLKISSIMQSQNISFYKFNNYLINLYNF